MRNTRLSTAFLSRKEPGPGVAERKCLHVISRNGFILCFSDQFLTVGGSVLLGTFCIQTSWCLCCFSSCSLDLKKRKRGMERKSIGEMNPPLLFSPHFVFCSVPLIESREWDEEQWWRGGASLPILQPELTGPRMGWLCSRSHALNPKRAGGALNVVLLLSSPLSPLDVPRVCLPARASVGKVHFLLWLSPYPCKMW